MAVMTKRQFDAELKRRREAGERSAFVVAPGLYVDVRGETSALWRARVSVGSSRKWIDLGPLELYSIPEAAEAAAAARKAAREGRDPAAERRAAKAAAVAASVTFGAFAAELVDTIESGFKSDKHKAQWRSTLAQHAGALADKSLDEIDTADILAVLHPIWSTIPETASRLRGRIERILDAARARGLRSGENPARWRGHLDSLLPPRGLLSRGHHAALPWKDVPRFVEALRTRDAPAARLLEFTILTCARSGEARGARWSEFDLEAGLWVVPALRMKASEAHRVPLSSAALEIVERQRGAHGSLLFPSQGGGVPSDMIFAALLRRMKCGEPGGPWPKVTAHGFRSSFRDWAQEAARADFVVAEKCLAHRVGSAVERAYARSDLLEQRRDLMERWGAYCSGEAGAVIAFPRRAG